MNYKTSISGRATSCINLQIKDFSKGKFLVSTCKCNSHISTEIDTHTYSHSTKIAQFISLFLHLLHLFKEKEK